MNIDSPSNNPKSGPSQDEKPGGFKWVKLLGPVFLSAVIALPSGLPSWFDGLPWVGFNETLVMAVLLPFLLIVGRGFVFTRGPVLFLFVLFILKMVAFLGAPSSGWQTRVFPDMTLDEVKQNKWRKGMYDAVTSGKWVKTYATNWEQNSSAIFQTPWTQKSQFPLDWFLPHTVAEKNEREQFDSLHPWISFEGAATLSSGSRLVLIAQGVVDGSLSFFGTEGEQVKVPIAKDFQEARNMASQAPEGSGRIAGKLKFEGLEWSFIPVLVDQEGKVSSDLGRKVLWQDSSVLKTSPKTLEYFGWLSWVTDVGLCLFFSIWGIWSFRNLFFERILTPPLAVFSVMVVALTFVLDPFYTFAIKTFHLIDPSKITNLGFSIVIVGVAFLFWTIRQNDYRNFRADHLGTTLFLLFGPAVLIFFSYKWIPQIGNWSIWSQGDDWTAYQNFARKIIVDGEWLSAGEGVFVMQPLYRYFVGIYHLLFGQSAFVQRMADVACVLGSTIIIARLVVMFRLSCLVAFLSALAYLMANLIGTFRYRIGEGLVENHAMIFLMLAALHLYKSREGRISTVLLATAFGIFGYWMRQDHLGAIAGLVFLALEPAGPLTTGWKGYWEQFIRNWKKIAMYWGGGILSVLLICYRNWYLGGSFYPTDKSHPNFIGEFERGKFYLILTGNEWPVFPSISGIIVTLGVFFALIALVWHPRFLENFPLSLGVIFIGLLTPYAFLWTGAYEPRFSIHILPLAILSWAFVLNNYFAKNNILQNSGWGGR
ncbi:MAG: hypothetical protein VW455_06275 [Nitrospinota bacterium]